MRKLLSSLFSAFERKSLAVPSSDLLEILGVSQTTAAGISVTPGTALRCTAVAAAVRAISDPIAVLPLRLIEKGADGSRKPVPDHPAARMMAGDWCPWLTSHEGRRQITLDALMSDTGGIGLVTRVDGHAREIIRLPPGSVAVEWSTLGEPTYTLTQDTISRRLDPADVIHLVSPFTLPPTCKAPLTLCREAVGLALTMEQHAARLFGRGGRPSGMLSFTDALAPEAVKRIRDTWTLAHGGSNSGNTAILDRGASFTPLALNSVDAQFLELRTFAVEEIARAFGVPPHRIYELGRATWSNITDMGREFVDFTLSPWLKAWEASLARALLTAEERQTYCVEFDTDDLTLPSLGDQAEAYGKLITARVANPNEVRAWMGLAPYQGGDQFENPNTTSGGGLPADSTGVPA
ncbi:hypothetical protein ABB55_27240 [Prosthecomicrobium hirschii]|uniref:Portal protein n=1 Tax=Prosthecodimorpha hirschii TaxID=665126 RepID=A0A0P6WGA7_9HYPH|nr:phage portal protein [Prosthecomicrobium hirschii]KPL55475.1 hypothetical protein ABB55_27240 [Prosthecomicrobium hirschii]